MIFTEIIQLVKEWNMFGQFLFVMGIATLGTTILLAFVGLIGNFVNNTIPVLLRGYPPENTPEDEDN